MVDFCVLGDYVYAAGSGGVCRGGITQMLSVTEYDNSNFDASVSLNPATGSVVISSTQQLTNVALYLLDVTGRTVLSRTGITGTEFSFDRGGLVTGMYYYKLVQDNAIILTGKIAYN